MRSNEFAKGPTKPALVMNLSVEKFRRAISEAEGAVIRKRAQAVGQRIRGEDGVG